VTHILTGGRLDSRSDQRVTAYAISYNIGGWKWEWYRGVLQDAAGVEELVLAGNKLQGGIQVNELTDSQGSLGILAKAIRIHPVRWVNHISLQVAPFCFLLPLRQFHVHQNDTLHHLEIISRTHRRMCPVCTLYLTPTADVSGVDFYLLFD